MNFQQLEYIIAVNQQKHFGKAADQCFVTQATLSAMIKKLEQELDVIIFDRKKQPTLTTETGRLVVELAQEIISKRDELIHATQAEQKILSGTISLGIIPTVASSLLPLILPALFAHYPDLELQVTELNTEDIVSQLETNQLDIGILATPLKNPNIIEEVLYYESMLVYGAREVKKKQISTADLRNSHIWLLEEGNCFRTQSVSLCDIKESQDNQLKLASSSFDTLINLTDQFGGFTLIPELFQHSLSADKKSFTKQFVKPIPVREISLVYSRPYALKNSIYRLAELIREIVPAQLQSSRLNAKDMSILGISA